MTEPLVAIIIPHHLEENREYLKLCVQSVYKQTYQNFICWIVSSTEKPVNKIFDTDQDEAFAHKQGFDPVPGDDRFGNFWRPPAKKVWQKHEAVMPMLPKETEYILLLSDDVVISKNLISNMIQSYKHREIIMNPVSNSDNGSVYEIYEPDAIYLKPNQTLETISQKAVEILNPLEFSKILMPVPPTHLSFYCTMMNKSVYDKVGGLDPNLEYRHNDQDFCIRAAQKGVMTAINFGAFAFHFGSRTIRTIPEAEKDKCTQYFKKKWGIA